MVNPYIHLYSSYKIPSLALGIFLYPNHRCTSGVFSSLPLRPSSRALPATPHKVNTFPGFNRVLLNGNEGGSYCGNGKAGRGAAGLPTTSLLTYELYDNPISFLYCLIQVIVYNYLIKTTRERKFILCF